MLALERSFSAVGSSKTRRDALNGVFAALGAPQVIVLTLVVVIAAGLLWLARHAQQHGQLA